MASEPDPPTTTTIPSDPSISAPPEPSKPAKPPPRAPLLQKFRIYLLRYLLHAARTTDRTLTRLGALLSTPTGTDALLCTLAYTLELLHALLSRLLSSRLESFATSIASKADALLLPGETLIATLPAPPTTKLLAQAVGSIKALAAVIGDFRIFVRLWGLVGIYTWAKGTWNSPLGDGAGRKEVWVRRITWGQIASCAAFQVLENGAYLASKGALTGDVWAGEVGKARETRWWVWSSRFWAAHVVLELVRLGVWRYYRDEPSTGREGGKEKERLDDGEKEGKLLREEKRREEWCWWRDLVSNVAYLPMTLHWSVEDEKGLLSDWGVGLCGSVAGGALLVDAWRATA